MQNYVRHYTESIFVYCETRLNEAHVSRTASGYHRCDLSSIIMITRSFLNGTIIFSTILDALSGINSSFFLSTSRTSLKNQSLLASNALFKSLTSIPRMCLCSESYLNTESKNLGYTRKSNTWSQRCNDLSVRCGFINFCISDRQRSRDPDRYS